MKCKHSVSGLILLTGAMVLLLRSTAAQTAEEEVFELTAFEVSATEEQGYFVRDSNSATRFAVDRRDMPFSITTLSSALLDDAAVVDAIEALDMSSSATPTENVFTGNNNRPTIRGTSSPRFFVDGVFYNSTVAPGGVAVDRIEILKGSSSMLYGQGEPGGTVNYTLKRPLKETQGRLQLMAGNFNERDFKVDFTTPLDTEKTLTVRMGYGYFYGESEHDRYSSLKRDAFARIRWEYDGYDRFVDFWHVYADTYNEGLVQHVLDGSHGITNLQMKRFLYTQYTAFDLPNPLEQGMMNPSSHNDTAEGSFADVQTNSSTLTLNHRLNDTFVVRLSYNHTKMPRYLWRNLADPVRSVEKQQSRNYLIVDPETGIPAIFSTKLGDIVKNTGGQLRDDALISDSYVANLLGEFRFEHFTWKTVLGFDYISEVFESESLFSSWHYEQRGNGTSALKDFGGRIPIVLGNVFRPEEGLKANSEPLATYTIHSGFTSNENAGSGYYSTNFLEFFSGRLTFVGSVRYDEGEIQTDAYRPERTDGEDPFISGDPGAYEQTTYSIGGNWLVHRNFGLFANFATSFRPDVSLQTGPDQLPIPPEKRDPFEGEGWDAGLKFSSDNGKIFAMFTAFETRKRNLWGRTEGQAIDEDGNLLWEDVDQTIPTIISYDIQTGEEFVSGVEVELNAEFLDDFEFRFGWTWLVEAEVSEDENEFLVGQELANSPEHKIVAGLKYHIRSGPLAYSQIGVNLTALIDERIYWVGQSTTQLNVGHLGEGSPYIGEPDRFWGKGYTKVDLFLSKRFQFDNGIDLWVRLNIYNLLNEDYQRYRQRGDPVSGRLTFDFRW